MALFYLLKQWLGTAMIYKGYEITEDVTFDVEIDGVYWMCETIEEIKRIIDDVSVNDET